MRLWRGPAVQLHFRDGTVTAASTRWQAANAATVFAAAMLTLLERSSFFQGLA